MKNLILVFVVALAFSTMAMASDIAISTQANWWSQGAADREMQEIVDNVTAVSVERFSATEQAALADWVADHTGDGTSDLLILCGAFPDTIYEPGNGQADNSLAELFLDDGNTIINTGDYMFYVVNGAGTNAAGGLQTMMDIPGITMWDDDTAVVVTADGQDYTPTLVNFATDRPFHLDELQGDWEPELILAQNAAGTRADPVIVVNTLTGGRLGIFYQTASQDDDPRGEVISEWINNWYLLYVAGGNPFARRPDPKDGALHSDTWITMSWNAGDFAVSHDVYLGDNFDDVNNGTGDAFRGNQASTYFVAGFPGFPYPDGLVPGTTYYWRIDEVNDADPNSPWKGPVWSFSVPPKKAYNPIPADNAKFIDPQDLTLRWTGGFGAKLHTVYFGYILKDVDAAAGGLPQGITTYKPAGPLAPGTTYFWRVDEFDAAATHKGDVWSFQVAKDGGGIKGDYYKGMNFENLVLTRIDPQIDFSWAAGEPDPKVGIDSFSVRWTGEVEAAFTETYKFYARADDGVRLWVDGIQLVNAWIDQGATEYSGELDLIAGNTYSIVMEMYENGGDAVAELRWSSPSTPKQIIPQAALSLLKKANSPKPSSGTVGVSLMSTLTWRPGSFAASHGVYFGTDADAVANATTASPEYKGSKALGDESYDPGKLAWDTTYYWRIDEVNNTNPDSPWKGNVWNFGTGPFLVVDDFESYDDIDPAPGEPGADRIFDKWIDGFGTTTNGALVGNDLPPYAEQTIVHGGAQAMIYRYDNANKTSEATLTLVYPRDWTEEGVAKLSLWLRGASANSAERMYLALNGTAVVYHDDLAATQLTGWNEWVIDLQTFAGVNLANVNSITIGIGTKNSPAAGGAGTMYFDDIRLYR
ncbi:MAG: PA14 domain-containing protein [Planctomycetota bacterium]